MQGLKIDFFQMWPPWSFTWLIYANKTYFYSRFAASFVSDWCDLIYLYVKTVKKIDLHKVSVIVHSYEIRILMIYQTCDQHNFEVSDEAACGFIIIIIRVSKNNCLEK